MPADNNMRRGNHFASGPAQTNGPKRGASPIGGQGFGSQSPDTTQEFMNAHRAAHVNHSQPRAASYAQQPTAAAPKPAGSARRTQRAAGTAYQPAASAYQGGRSNPYGGQGGSQGRPYSPGYSPSNQPPKKKRGKAVGIVVSLILLGLLVFGGATGFFLYKDAKGLMSQSHTLIEEVSSMKGYLKEGEGEQLNATAQSISDQISSMRETIDGPAWTIASFVPVYGDDIKLVRGLLKQADVLAEDALLPACDQLADFKLSELLSDGSINVDMLKSLISTLQDVEPVVSSSIDAIDALPEPHVGKLKGIMDKFKEPMKSAKGVLGNINEIAPLLPQMLGADGARTYVLVAQQNAELRSTGGLGGSVGTLTINNGAISMGEFEAGNAVNGDAALKGEVTSEEEALFTDRMAVRVTDTNFNPDFPRVAHFVKAMWEAKTNQHVDGVVFIDPVFLQYFLALTGGVDSEGISVTGDNAARMLLHDAYNTLSVEQTDAFFSSVAGQVFDQIMGNLGEVGFEGLFKTVKRGIDEHRLLVWMESADEESLIEKMGCSGALNSDESKPELGVFFSDETWSKISWYFSSNTEVGEGVKNANGSTTYHVTTTMTNNLTLGEAGQQVSYITGYHPNKKTIADMFMHVYLVAPAGGSITNITTDGGDFSPQRFTQMPYRDWTFHTASPVIGGGETITISYDVTVSAAATEPLAVRTTPTAQVVAGWGPNAADAVEAPEGAAE